MTSFETAFQETLKNEGGYSNHPNDKGGETYAGISRKNFQYWTGWKIIDEQKRATGFPAILNTNALLIIQIKDFYKAEFWDKLKLDIVKSQEVASKLFDIAVNCGVSFAAKALQRTLNVANQGGKYYPDLLVDGKVGLKTIAALNAHPNQSVIFKCLNTLQGDHYIEIAEKNPSQEDFINGWFRYRIAAVIDETTDHIA